MRHLTKQQAGAKQKLRRVWDLALQSNVGDLDESTKRLLDALDECEASIRHVVRQFPNNSFVTRQYARFAQELLADEPLAADMADKSRALQRGVLVSADKAHEWGAHAFPGLPGGGHDRPAAGESENEVEFEVSEGAALIADRIAALPFPGVRAALLLQVALFAAFVCAEIPAIVLIASGLAWQLIAPLEFFNNIGLLRAEAYIVSGLAQQTVYTRLAPVPGRTPPPPPPPPPEGAPPPESFGGVWELGRMLEFWARRLSVTLQDVMTFQVWESTDRHVKESQRKMFEADHEFLYFDSENQSKGMVSLVTALIGIVTSQETIVAAVNTTVESIHSSSFRNTNYNVPVLTPHIQAAIDELVLYVQEHDTRLADAYSAVIYASIGVGVAAIVGCLAFEIAWINGNKEKVYRCLTALPKSNVSQIAENLRICKCKTDGSDSVNNETSKQDDNIMKIFVAGRSTAVAGLDGHFLMVASVCITAGCFAGALALTRNLIIEQSTTVTHILPHMSYLLGAFGAVFQAMTDMFTMYWFETPFASSVWTKETLVNRFEWSFVRFNTMYVNVRFGNVTQDLPPYVGYAKASKEAEQRLHCSASFALPRSLSEATQCFRPDIIYGALETLLQARIALYRANASQPRLYECTATQGLLTLLVYPIFELLIDPMYTVIDGTIRTELTNGTQLTYPIVIILVVLAIAFEAVAIADIIGVQTHMRRVLRLLLHCPASVVLQTPKVMAILSGDFAARRRDESAKTGAFFRQVVAQLPDAIVTVDSVTGRVTALNVAGERLFGANAIDADLKVLIGVQWSERLAQVLAASSDAKPITEQLVFRKDEATTLNLEVTIHTMQDSIVYVFSDVTATVKYNTLIALERAKSDSLLKSILPPLLVPRVKAGETNISFEVSSATIVFVDIVSFTPWCGLSTAEKVMMTLNCLFKKFDSNCAAQRTMTRIKCIGDCYMAAGGVFCEVNQPTEHAKQVVQFGLDSLASVTELNAELDENLEIRVGINTGGPIVGGVLGGGVAKPTFEILGPPINMAQQMEHHGVPMQVHISRTVYELIYGDMFVVKEKGTIEVKGVQVVTYLVSEQNPRQHVA